MDSEVFISSSRLNYLLHEDNILTFDCRFSLLDSNAGYRSYMEGHIPGAVFADLNVDLSGDFENEPGRHPLPIFIEFKSWLEKIGAVISQKVIVYDDVGGGIAARLWWMLIQIGFHSVKILNGGIISWIKQGFILEKSIIQREKSKIELSISSWTEGPYTLYDADDIRERKKLNTLLDSRSPKRYLGEEEPYDKIPGHIPGAINYFWQDNLTDVSELKDKEEVKKQISVLGLNNENEVTIYCGSGVTACFNIAIFAHLNLPIPSFYPGSFSDWIENYPDKIETR